MTANPHEAAARTAKAHRLAAAYVEGVATYLGCATADLYATTSQRALLADLAAASATAVDLWAVVASQAGIRPPSTATIAAAVQVLRSQADQADRYDTAKANPLRGLPG